MHKFWVNYYVIKEGTPSRKFVLNNTVRNQIQLRTLLKRDPSQLKPWDLFSIYDRQSVITAYASSSVTVFDPRKAAAALGTRVAKSPRRPSASSSAQTCRNFQTNIMGTSTSGNSARARVTLLITQLSSRLL